MKTAEQKGIPPVLERFELKYTVPFSMVEPISRFVEVYCSLDKYSADSADNFYRVNNLYMDSPGFLFLKMRRERAENRFNMRIRSYGNNPVPPFFVEVKQKIGDLVKKYRAPLSGDSFLRHFQENDTIKSLYEGNAEHERNFDLFNRLTVTYDARPKILTQYRRKAYISDVDDYARVTFDIDLRFTPRSSYDPVPPAGSMIPYDSEQIFGGDANVILELKCYTRSVPLWMIDLIHCFDLKRRGFSKYMYGALQLLEFHRYASQDRVSSSAETV